MFFLSGGYQKPVPLKDRHINFSWWRNQMETFSVLLAICAGKSLVTGEFPAQRPVTRSFDIFFDLRLNKRLRKQWWDWWFETPSRPSWRQCNVNSDRVAEGMRYQVFNPFSDEIRKEYVFFNVRTTDSCTPKRNVSAFTNASSTANALINTKCVNRGDKC